MNSKYYSLEQLKWSNILLGSFYTIVDLRKRYLICIGLNVLIAIIYWFFVQYSGVYSAGVSAIVQGLSRFSYVVLSNANKEQAARVVSNVLFWTLYSTLNAPLAVFGYKRIGKHFTMMTFVGVVVADVVGLSLSFIPNADKFTKVFGETLSSKKFLEEKGVLLLSWSDKDDLVRIISLFFYALISTMLMAYLYAIIFIVGSSSGGGDFISYYFSIKKKRNIGTFIAIVNTTLLFLGTFLGSYVSASLISEANGNNGSSGSNNAHKWNFYLMFSPNLIVSFMASLFFGFLINQFYPNYKMTKVSVYSNKIGWISQHLIASGYSHTFTLYKGIGAYSGKTKWMGETICQYIELPELVRQINVLDDCAIVTISPLSRVLGSMNVLHKID